MKHKKSSLALSIMILALGGLGEMLQASTKTPPPPFDISSSSSKKIEVPVMKKQETSVSTVSSPIKISKIQPPSSLSSSVASQFPEVGPEEIHFSQTGPEELDLPSSKQADYEKILPAVNSWIKEHVHAIAEYLVNEEHLSAEEVDDLDIDRAMRQLMIFPKTPAIANQLDSNSFVKRHIVGLVRADMDYNVGMPVAEGLDARARGIVLNWIFQNYAAIAEYRDKTSGVALARDPYSVEEIVALAKELNISLEKIDKLGSSEELKLFLVNSFNRMYKVAGIIDPWVIANSHKLIKYLKNNNFTGADVTFSLIKRICAQMNIELPKKMVEMFPEDAKFPQAYLTSKIQDAWELGGGMTEEFKGKMPAFQSKSGKTFKEFITRDKYYVLEVIIPHLLSQDITTVKDRSDLNTVLIAWAKKLKEEFLRLAAKKHNLELNPKTRKSEEAESLKIQYEKVEADKERLAEFQRTLDGLSKEVLGDLIADLNVELPKAQLKYLAEIATVQNMIEILKVAKNAPVKVFPSSRSGSPVGRNR